MLLMHSRTCGNVIIGTFFLIQQFHRQEPQRQQTQRNVMMPTHPIPHLIIGQAALAFRMSKTFFDAIRLLDHACVFMQVGRLVTPRRFAKGHLSKFQKFP